MSFAPGGYVQGMKALIAVDHGPESRDAVAFAARLLGDDAEVVLLNVVKLNVPALAAMGPGFGAYGDPAAPIDWVDPDAETAGESVVEESGQPFDHPEARVEHGDAAARICAVAEEESVDLVILGTHDRGSWSRLWFGSVSDRVVHDAPCPVLVVR